MKVLICGIGSIGQRHYKNLQRLGHETAVLRSGKNTGYNTPFLEKFFTEQKEAGHPVREFFDFDTAVREFNPEAVWITNPNARHMDVALPAARASKHLFIEKPVSHTVAGTAELAELQKQHGLTIMVGYNLRFHPLLARMKALLDTGAIGRPLAAHATVGENIEDWHPWEDYRASYASWREGGGGVARCFSHDIDYLYWLMGKPKKIMAIGGKMTPLEGDAEDMVKSVWAYENGSITSLHMDYWQRPPVRSCHILGTEGTLMWDYYGQTLVLQPHGAGSTPQVWRMPDGFERNDMFMEETKDFISAIQENREPAIPLREGLDVLEIIENMSRQLTI